MHTRRYGHMVHEHYVERIRGIMQAREERIAALKTKRDAQKYVRQVRAAVRACFAPFPARTPLNARTTGQDDYGTYSLEKIIYESRPGFLVTASLYLPNNNAKKHSAVLGLCGHSMAGKAEEVYQSYAQGLARKGFVVLVIDPISQGERRQFYPVDGLPRPGLCAAHNLMGNAMRLVGDFFGTWRVWDAIRGLDYLLSRPEVDRKHVGVTGNSGGGTLTTYMSALDPRLSMAAPSCHISSCLADIENELPRDSEQCPPGMLARGLDLVDLLICRAPRPTLILAQHDDFFDERAAARAFLDLQKVHRLLGSNGAAYFAGPRNHGYHLENREAMYEFFMHHAGIAGSAKERGVRTVTPERLFATPKGQTRKLGSRPVFDFTRETAETMEKQRKRLSAAELVRTAEKILALPPIKGAPHYRVLRYVAGPDKFGVRYQFAIHTENEHNPPMIQSILTMFGPIPYGTRFPATHIRLYIGHISSLEDAQKVRPIVRLRKARKPFFTIDPRGTGETMAYTCDQNSHLAAYSSDYLYAVTCDMLGETYLGRRVFDVMRTMDCLLANKVKSIELVGRGLGSITAAFAGLLHPSKPKVKLLHYLPSYRVITSAPVHDWPFSCMPPGILKYFDLPDVYRTLGKRLQKSSPWNARMR